jgi:hypothetical protein
MSDQLQGERRKLNLLPGRISIVRTMSQYSTYVVTVEIVVEIC